MRSLEHWTKYLEQQESELRQALEEHDNPEEESAVQTTVSVAEPAPRVEDAAMKSAVQMRKKLPEKLLAGDGRREAAQNSYQGFKETREELLQRLLDPSLTLEEAARVLNVCPATVRRYTNRGQLKHFRTAGNQRRFRLSDVLAFMEDQTSDEVD